MSSDAPILGTPPEVIAFGQSFLQGHLAGLVPCFRILLLLLVMPGRVGHLLTALLPHGLQNSPDCLGQSISLLYSTTQDFNSKVHYVLQTPTELAKSIVHGHASTTLSNATAAGQVCAVQSY